MLLDVPGHSPEEQWGRIWRSVGHLPTETAEVLFCGINTISRCDINPSQWRLETVYERLDTNSIFTQLIVSEYFIAYSHCESCKSYIKIVIILVKTPYNLTDCYSEGNGTPVFIRQEAEWDPVPFYTVCWRTVHSTSSRIWVPAVESVLH
jgi:hypothetical protein